MPCTWPSIDHSQLSPNGRVSKRARKAMHTVNAALLFPPELQAEIRANRRANQPTKQERLRRQAANLRDLAARGMKPRAFPKEAARLEAEAAALDGSETK